ncbi:MAG: bifunctional phosphoribosylaminoimidazolecarboxamide formyltransferase/IMP cyclohydrolase, partial [Pseudomonadota bacterium]
CNLYAFDKVCNKDEKEVPLEELIENIDVGGPTMIRAAAKNFVDVAVLTHPLQYTALIEQLKSGVTYETRKNLAKEAFNLTASYDALITGALEKRFTGEPLSFFFSPSNGTPLRYGENPHQRGYLLKNPFEWGPAYLQPIQGKEPSYNNYLDADSAIALAHDLTTLKIKNFDYGVVIVKHLNPCGAALSTNIQQALEMAWACDPVSSFGSIIAFTHELDEQCANFFEDKFIEVILAPSYSAKAKQILANKKNLRLFEIDPRKIPSKRKEIRTICGGALYQDADEGFQEEFQVKGQKGFSKEILEIAPFGVAVTKHLKSNAIGIFHQTAQGVSMSGAGMGNPNRIVSIKHAIEKAKEIGHTDLKNHLLVSDAFFPFADSIHLSHQAGIRNIIQPGGSLRDNEVIAISDSLGVAMAFTGRRHFRD